MSKLQSGQAAASFTPAQLRQYRDQFEMYDLNGDGLISVAELANVSQKIGYRLTDEKVAEIMKAHDLDANGYLSFNEFLTAWPLNFNNIPRQEHKKAEVRRMFQEFDRDGNGVVTMDEAHGILRKELAFTPQQSIQMVRKFDKNNDGHLDYEEFVKFFSTVKSKANEIKEMFLRFDKDESKSVSVNEAKQMLRQLNIPDHDIEMLVAMHDKNSDGELQYEEFVSFLVHS